MAQQVFKQKENEKNFNVTNNKKCKEPSDSQINNKKYQPEQISPISTFCTNKNSKIQLPYLSNSKAGTITVLRKINRFYKKSFSYNFQGSLKLNPMPERKKKLTFYSPQLSRIDQFCFDCINQ